MEKDRNMTNNQFMTPYLEENADKYTPKNFLEEHENITFFDNDLQSRQCVTKNLSI